MSNLKPVLFLLLLSLTLSQFPQTQTPISLSFDNFQIPTKQICIYRGQTIVNIEKGNQSSIEFFVVIFEEKLKCTYKKCFYGYVDNYTFVDNGKSEFVKGFRNPKLQKNQPIFKFQVNTLDDYKITHGKNLSSMFSQIIQITCQKINPFYNQPPQRTPSSKFGIQSNIAGGPSFPKQRYAFRQPKFQILKPACTKNNCNKVATVREKIALKDVEAKKSFLSEQVQLNEKDEVVINEQTYDFDIGSDRNLDTAAEDSVQIENFRGNVKFGFYLEEKKRIPERISSAIVKEANFLLASRSSISFTKASLQRSQETQIQAEVLPDEPILQVNPAVSKFLPKPTIQVNPAVSNFLNEKAIAAPKRQKKPGDGDSIRFPGQKFNGVDIIQAFKKASSLFKPVKGKKTTTFVDKERKIYRKKILGKVFRIDFRTKCQLIQFSYDHKIRCRGWVRFNFFGRKVPIQVFDFTKSISRIWKFKESFPGSVGFRIRLILPFRLIRIRFYIRVNYKTDLEVQSKVIKKNPFTLSIKPSAVFRATTDSYAGVRVGLFGLLEGGVFIKGTLARGKTDPEVRAIYKFGQREIQLKVKWWAQLWTFELKWGFYWRHRRIRRRWSSRKIIKQWSLKSKYLNKKIYEDTIPIKV